MLHENDHPNLNVDTLSIQNNRKLKSYTVEFFLGKFLFAPHRDSNSRLPDLKSNALPLS